jgi:hypothetical protein
MLFVEKTLYYQTTGTLRMPKYGVWKVSPFQEQAKEDNQECNRSSREIHPQNSNKEYIGVT